MRALLWSSLVMFCALPAFANSPEPSDKDIARAAQTCTADGAFGVRFKEKVLLPPAPVKGFPETDVAPFHLGLVAAGSQGVRNITGVASFAKAPMSQEDRLALTAWFFQKFDHQIATTRHFSKREAKQDLSLYTFNEGFLLEIVRLGTEVRLSCTHGSRDSVSPNPLP